MKIKCDYFQIVGNGKNSVCGNTIKIPDNYEAGNKIMNKAGWRKCGGFFNDCKATVPSWGYFCPVHAKDNQFYQETLRQNETKKRRLKWKTENLTIQMIIVIGRTGKRTRRQGIWKIGNGRSRIMERGSEMKTSNYDKNGIYYPMYWEVYDVWDYPSFLRKWRNDDYDCRYQNVWRHHNGRKKTNKAIEKARSLACYDDFISDVVEFYDKKHFITPKQEEILWKVISDVEEILSSEKFDESVYKSYGGQK